MTWLLNQLQKVFGSFGNKRDASNAEPSDHRKTSQIQPQIDVSRRVSSPPDDIPTPQRDPHRPSTAALRQSNSSILKDTADPVASVPDTHQRLDATPAAMPGGQPETPSFPTAVSELMTPSRPVSPASDTSPALSDDPATSIASDAEVSEPVAEPPAAEDIPAIHDLLPAVETEPIQAPPITEPSAPADSPTITPADSPNDELNQTPDQAPAIVVEYSEPEPAIEPAKRVNMPSSNITADVGLYSPPAPVAEPESPAQSPLENQTAHIEPVGVSASTSATPTPSQASLNPPAEVPSCAMTKKGVVKLLFTLKKGNFHGYIAPDDGSKDILFHQKYINADIFERLERGSRVIAAIKLMEGKVYATRVDLLAE